MNLQDRSLRHLPFFEALAGMQETSPDWYATSAGLVTLRLVDAWLEGGTAVVSADSWGVHAVRSAIQDVEAADPTRAILAGLLETVESAPEPDVTLLTPRLMAFGRSLDFKGRWQLAADVYEMIVSHVAPATDADLIIDANFRLAYCRRMLGQLDVAERAYAEAGRIASQINDMVRVLRAEVGAAKIVLARGNLPQAESMLDATIARARGDHMTEIRAIALHDRSTVAHARGEYERAIGLAHQALPLTSNAMGRDRLLADIAASFMSLGVRSAARDALLVLAATAQEQFSRWSATISLMEVALHDGFEPLFEQHRRELANAQLSPELAASYALTSGRGFRRFDRTDAARESLRRAVRIAESHGFNRIFFDAERELFELERGVDTERRAPTSMPESVRDVAIELEELRLATAGT